MIAAIEQVLEKEVRPDLLHHEGNVEIVEYKDGILKVRLLGQCSGCPSAALTTEELIAAKVKAALPQVKDVVLVNEVSEELIAMAKQILNERRQQGRKNGDRN